MMLRNGILSTLRGRWRTALFAALILLMALSLTLGAGMWAYCSAQLKALDENYTSIALMEYMGADYPDENAADAFARAAAAETDSSAIAAITPLPRWAVIGPLQTNKAGQLAAFADEFQALDRPKVAAALQRRLADAAVPAAAPVSTSYSSAEHSPGVTGRTLDVLIQVNTSHEPQKAGIAPEDVEAFVADFGPDGPYPNLRLRGFMTMAMIADPSSPDGDEDVRRCFAALRELRDRLAPDAPDGVTLDELSMGMSGDFELAIAEGATTVRVGRAIFGERPKP